MSEEGAIDSRLLGEEARSVSRNGCVTSPTATRKGSPWPTRRQSRLRRQAVADTLSGMMVTRHRMMMCAACAAILTTIHTAEAQDGTPEPQTEPAATEMHSTGMVVAGSVITGLGILAVGAGYGLVALFSSANDYDTSWHTSPIIVPALSSLLGAGIPLIMMGAVNLGANDMAIVRGGAALTTLGVGITANAPWLLGWGMDNSSSGGCSAIDIESGICIRYEPEYTDGKVYAGAVMLVGGVGAMAAGITLFVMGNAPGPSAPRDTGTSLIPITRVGPTSASLTWTF